MYRKITLISSFILVIDQIIKYLFSNYITGFVLIPNFISFVYAENKGVAFSMLSGSRIFIILMTIFLCFIITYMLKKEKYNKKNEKLIILSYGFLFGGILGNLLDRIIRGYVIDYVSLNLVGYRFPIFNLADLFITIGVILLLIKSFKEDKGHA